VKVKLYEEDFVI